MEYFNDLLLDFERVTRVKASAIVSRDGLIIASLSDTEFEEELIGGMAAQITLLGERTCEALLDTTANNVIIDSDKGTIILSQAGIHAVIISILDQQNLGMTLLYLKKLIKSTRSLLEEIPPA